MKQSKTVELGPANLDRAFVGLLAANQRKLFAYIVSLVANVNDADDILQESVYVMMNKFHEFEQGTDFLAWATTIAYYRVLEFRRKKSKQELFFDDETLSCLHEEAKSELQDADDYIGHLKDCMRKLSDNDFNLVKLRYSNDMSVRDIASRFGRTIQSIYRSISRVENLLRICIERQVAS
jgi:RNA polymerase sigma-70 factor (ECF subfamily)